MTPRRVDFLHHREDLQVLVLGQLGFTTAFIAKKTGLSFAQVLYRLSKGHVQRSHYRQGHKTEATELVLDRVETVLRERTRKSLQGESKNGQ